MNAKLLKQKANKKKTSDDEEDEEMDEDVVQGLSQKSTKSKKGHGHGHQNTTACIDILPHDEKELRLMLKEVKKSIKLLEK